MSEKSLDIITIGESLIELSSNQKLEDAECLHKYYGGDSLVVAVAASRLKSKVGFITCLGNDVFKQFLVKSWEKEGLDTSFVTCTEDNNGIYFVARVVGEGKEFAHYRKKIAPAKLSIDNINEDYIKSAKVVYASGVTMSLSIQAREAVKKAFEVAKENGVLTAYDPNFSKLLSSEEEAREYIAEIFPLTDILFISENSDIRTLYELESVEQAIKRLTDYGIDTIIVKSSKDKGYYVNNNQSTIFVPFYTETTVDTTSSGDAFNGAYLHSVTEGYSPSESAKIASIAAGLQAQGIGAIKSVPYYDEVFKIYKNGV